MAVIILIVTLLTLLLFEFVPPQFPYYCSSHLSPTDADTAGSGPPPPGRRRVHAGRQTQLVPDHGGVTGPAAAHVVAH